MAPGRFRKTRGSFWDTVKSIGSGIGKFFNQAASVVSPIANVLGNAFQGTQFGDVVQGIGNAVNTANNVVQGIGGVVQGAVPQLGGAGGMQGAGVGGHPGPQQRGPPGPQRRRQFLGGGGMPPGMQQGGVQQPTAQAVA